MKAVVAAFNQEKALVGAFSVITTLLVDLRFKLYSLSATKQLAGLGWRYDAVLPLSVAGCCWPLAAAAAVAATEAMPG